MEAKFEFARDVGTVESKGTGEDVEVSVSPTFYSNREKYIDVAVLTVKTNTGVVVGKTKIQVDKEKGGVRSVDLVESQELPVDEKHLKEDQDRTAKELS